MTKRKFEERDPRELKNHPLNVSIYGDTLEPEFIEDIRANGVEDELLILPDGTIVSGHRRRQAAIICELSAVPVKVMADPGDPLLVERLLLRSNRNSREKTKEQSAREYEHLVRIESALAAKRRENTLKQSTSTVPGISRNGEPGEAKDIAAEEVGMSRKTADKAVEVVHKIDKLAASGKQEQAEKLRDTLNNKSVSAAAKQAGVDKKKKATKPVREPGDETEHDATKPPRKGKEPRDSNGTVIPEKLSGIFASLDHFKQAEAGLGALQGGVANAARLLPRGALNSSGIDDHCRTIHKLLTMAKPTVVCPKCEGTGDASCKACRGLGYMTGAGT